MAGRQKLPIAVIEARGKSHFTDAEKERRRAEEVQMPPSLREIAVPEYLIDYPNLVRRFDVLAEMLAKLMPDNFGQPDAELLARYVVSEDTYEEATKLVRASKTAKGIKDAQMIQDKAFKQAQACARDLGMTVTSRCKLVVPVPKDDDDGGEEFDL